MKSYISYTHLYQFYEMTDLPTILSPQIAPTNSSGTARPGANAAASGVGGAYGPPLGVAVLFGPTENTRSEIMP